jgi:tRNA G18 (ribose-2'-O)-methylase SpoU
MRIISIDDPDDPRIAAYRDIRERDLTGREGLFIAEGEVVLRNLVSSASLCRPRSMLMAGKRVAAMAEIIGAAPEDMPVYSASQTVLDSIAGFPLHRGLLALGEKPEPEEASAVLDRLGDNAVVVAAEGIGNHDNIGGLFRNAAAFGAGAVLLDDRCGDPFYRKSVRVSVGAVLRVPSPRPLPLEELVAALEAARFEVIALTPSATEPLVALRPGGRRALLLGSEGSGLPRGIIDRCRAVGIAMAGDFDSLNVAATSAIALHQLTAATGSEFPGCARLGEQNAPNG